MRWKYITFITGFLFFILIYILIFESKRAVVISLVAVTNDHLTTLKKFKHNLEKASEKLLNPDDKYMLPLGFINNTKFYPEDFLHNITLPIIVSYAMSGKQDQVVSFAKNVAKMLPNYFTFLYNIGLKEYEHYLLQNFCRTTHCTVINFEWDQFPLYVRNNVDLFRPLIIQDALNKVGAVFYVESNLRFTTSNLSSLIKQAKEHGVLTWRDKYPISAITHPKMYDYFKTVPHKFYFVSSIDPSRLLIYKVPHVHYNVMFPWIKCVLIRSCVHPVGSQDSGCQFDKKPLYRYSGCHKTGIAPLSIILSTYFNFTARNYINDDDNDDETLFRNISSEDVKLELSLLVKNSSDFKYN